MTPARASVRSGARLMVESWSTPWATLAWVWALLSAVIPFRAFAATSEATPAQVLEHLLKQKWQLEPHDKDMIVMWHRFRYALNSEQKEIQASLVVEGEDAIHTAMAKTVGLPMGIAAKLILQEKIRQRGVVIPVDAEIYEPVLAELKELGIELVEREM